MSDKDGDKKPKAEEGTIKYALDKDLEDLLRNTFGIRPDDDKHELIQSLFYDGITSWEMFIRLQPEAIESLTKKADRNNRVQIGKSIRMDLNVLVEYINDTIDSQEEGEDNAWNIDYYDSKTLIKHLRSYYKLKKTQAASNPTTPATTNVGTGSFTNNRSKTERALDNWERRKRDKTNFEILREDSRYKLWKESFDAEIKVQGLSRLIDPNFNKKKDLQDSFDRELYDKQSDYFWTVLLYSLQNPLAEATLGKHRQDDARTAFLAVDEKMRGKISQMYNVSNLSDTLRDLHIATFNGTRVQFIAHWFETLRQLTQAGDKKDELGYIHVRSILMRALDTDRDLTNSFTDLKDEPDRDVAVATMMDHLLEKAVLFDGRDGNKTTNDTRKLSALLHQLGIAHDEEILINQTRRRGPPADVKLPDDLYARFSPDDRRTWRSLSDDAKRAIVRLLDGTPTAPTGNSRNLVQRKAYLHDQDNIDTTSDTASKITALRHTLASVDAQLQAIHSATGDDTAFTAMSSITSGSRPPSLKTPQERKTSESESQNADEKLPYKSDLHRTHPTRVMASTAQRSLEDRSVSFHGGEQSHDFYAGKHHLFYSHDERDIDQSRTDTHTTEVVYNVSRRQIKQETSLIDRGANGCVGGADCVWIGGPSPARHVHITGMDDHQVCDVPLGTVGAYVESNRGPVICIFNEVAYTGRGQSIISSIQMEHFRNKVDDRALGVGGGQQIITADGYNFPLSIINGLPYIQLRPYTRTEYSTLPHVIMTSDQIWNPRIYDKYINPKTRSYKNANPINTHLLPHTDYNVKGEYIGTYKSNVNATTTDTEPFWLSEREYARCENIARCVYTAELDDMDPDWREVFDTEIQAETSPRTHIATDVDYEKLKPYFAWVPTKLIRKTFSNSTQYGFIPASPDGNLFKRWSSPNPAMNVFRLQDDLLTDKVHSNTPAINGGHTAAQVFFGRKSHVIHPEPISKAIPFLHCLQNFVRKWGAPLRLLADHISYHASFQVLDYLRILWIQLWFSEAYYQHQNPFERRYQTFKRIVNRTMDRTATPPELWFLCMQYVAYILNRVSDPSLGYRQPIFVATGTVGDISSLMTFQWLEPVYFKLDNQQISFPDTPEALGYFVGIAEHVGHSMTYKIWSKTSKKILERSSVRSAWDTRFPNHRASLTPLKQMIPFGEDTPSVTDNDGSPDAPSSTPQNHGEHSQSRRPTDYIFSKVHPNKSTAPLSPDDEHYGECHYLKEETPDPIDNNDHTDDVTRTQYGEDGTPLVILLDDDGHPKLDTHGNAIMIPGRTNKDLKGRSFPRKFDDGSVLRARIIGPVDNTTPSGAKVADRFKIKYDRTQVEDTMAYNDIMNHIHRDLEENNGITWKFYRIMSHRDVNPKDPHYKNCTVNVTVEWENGEITEEPLNVMVRDYPVATAQYAKNYDLLDIPGWKRLKKIATREHLLKRLVKQAKLRSFRTAPKYMYGFQVPRNYEEAMEFDRRNGNTRWQDATALEMIQLKDYNTFIDKGLFAKTSIPHGFKQIRVHLVFAVKHDGRHKARLVADGHLTDIPLDSVYAGVVSIRGLRMVLFLAELNNLEAYATDIGNAYLEACTQEKVCIHAGPEFAELEGHLLIIYKALYGLRSSGKQFGDLLAACLQELGFFPSRAEPQIFLRRNGDTYEYIATYVDDLCLAMKDPKAFLKVLQSKPYSFKLKGSGPMSFHLGCGFERDDIGTLCMKPSKYIDKLAQGYEQMFGVKLGTKPRSPLEEGDHPELDTSELLDEDGIQKYQSLIGSLQWLITLGRWDIQTAVMTLSSFRAKPRKGHLLRARRVCAYVNRFKHYCIRFRTDEPDLSDLDSPAKVDWSKDVYGNHKEELPHDMPEPLGKKVTLIHWFDANLMHDVLSGKALTGCIHFANKTPIMWYSKKQSTSETATYGAEFCAGRTCIEHIIDLRNTFRYLGVPIHDISYVFGDNKSMIDSSTYPYSRLHKRHNILSYHFVRSMIARGFISLTHTSSDSNLADVLTKHWSYNSVKALLKPVFFHMGDTSDLYIDDD